MVGIPPTGTEKSFPTDGKGGIPCQEAHSISRKSQLEDQFRQVPCLILEGKWIVPMQQTELPIGLCLHLQCNPVGLIRGNLMEIKRTQRGHDEPCTSIMTLMCSPTHKPELL